MLDNPAPFGNPLQFEITFECLQELEEGAYHPLDAMIIHNTMRFNIQFFFNSNSLTKLTHVSFPLCYDLSSNCADLEWKVVYVGSAENSSHDQTLDEILVGPVPVGVNKFILQADAPDHSSIPHQDILGVTVILVTCSYREKEFVRVGYYVNNEYTDPYDEEQGAPTPLDMEKVVRTILADKPRVTRCVLYDTIEM